MGKVSLIIVFLLIPLYVCSEEYISPDIPSMDIIKAMYKKTWEHSEIQRVIGTKTTGYGTRYTVHFVSAYADPRLKGITHIRRLTCFMLENNAWMIYFGRGQTLVLTYEEN